MRESPRASGSQASNFYKKRMRGGGEGGTQTLPLPEAWTDGFRTWPGIDPLAKRTQEVYSGSLGGCDPGFGEMSWEQLTEKKARIQHVPCMALPLHVHHLSRCPGKLA